jgi:putative oxidoreductase
VAHELDFRNISIFFICVFAPGSRGGVLCSLDAADFRLVRWARYEGMLANWKEKYGIPTPIAMVGMLTEFLGSFALLIGFLTRPFALGLAIFMAVAIWKAHWEYGFFLARRPGDGSGIEYCLALFLMAVALLIGGGGALSIDGLLSR